jgi:hypothetical protein
VDRGGRFRAWIAALACNICATSAAGKARWHASHAGIMTPHERFGHGLKEIVAKMGARLQHIARR